MKVIHHILLNFVLFLTFNAVLGQATSDKPNILFIVIDDLNDYTSGYNGHPQINTPAIDQMAAWGTQFNNAHASSPKCAPSRTSMFTGKDLLYTDIYNNNSCKPFRDYFKPALDNEEVFTLFEYLKDSAGYFTYGINKSYHCFDTYFDFDSSTTNPCDKMLSWNKFSYFLNGDDTAINNYGNAHNDGVTNMAWAILPDSLENLMYDYRAIDSASLFLQQYADGTAEVCDRPFLMYIGLRRPHTPWFIPEKYYLPYYLKNFNETPFDYPYNNPVNSFPYNGVVSVPQPDTLYGDFFQLPAMGQYMAQFDTMYYNILNEVSAIDSVPGLDTLFTDDEILNILHRSQSANSLIAYLASVKFIDAQMQRLLDSLQQYPEIFNNTIIIFTSDHGFSLGEKRHWHKGTMWETDLRIPFIVADMRAPQQHTVNTPVSLLDIFPTLCDIAEIEHPVFSNGEKYLDGISLISFIEDGDLPIEKNTLATYKEHKDYQCSCFPQYSIRSDKFHYIIYRSNNEDWELDCNKPLSYIEEELYEIGINRETDPNEWDNLAYNEDYFPLKEYLQQWLPDSILYLQKSFNLIINNTFEECLLEQENTLNLYFEIYDTGGIAIAAPDDLNFIWTNNLSSDTLYGTNIIFPLNLISDDIFANNSKLIFYLQGIDTMNTIAAFDMKYFYLNPESAPVATFTLTEYMSSVFISDFSIEGNFSGYWWEINGDSMFYNQIPGPVYFDESGTHTIVCKVQYGNTNCLNVHIETIFLDVDTANPILKNSEQIFLFPNPAQHHVIAYLPSGFTKGTITLYSLSGSPVIYFDIPESTGNYYTMDVKQVSNGFYLLSYQNEDVVLTKNLIISR